MSSRPASLKAYKASSVSACCKISLCRSCSELPAYYHADDPLAAYDVDVSEEGKAIQTYLEKLL